MGANAILPAVIRTGCMPSAPQLGGAIVASCLYKELRMQRNRQAGCSYRKTANRIIKGAGRLVTCTVLTSHSHTPQAASQPAVPC